MSCSLNTVLNSFHSTTNTCQEKKPNIYRVFHFGIKLVKLKWLLGFGKKIGTAALLLISAFINPY